MGKLWVVRGRRRWVRCGPVPFPSTEQLDIPPSLAQTMVKIRAWYHKDRLKMIIST